MPVRTSTLSRKQNTERRTKKDRRVKNLGSPTGIERRLGLNRRKFLKIPIFLKFITLSALVIIVVISISSFFMLKKQRVQFRDQLIALGESLVRITSDQSPDKLLAEEELTLFQLIKNVTAEDQVIYAFIADSKNVIKAHSDPGKVNSQYIPSPAAKSDLRPDDVIVTNFFKDGAEILYFEKPITYQKIRVGTVALAISQHEIIENIESAKRFVSILTVIITFLGVLLSFVLSLYFSRPIQKLKEGTQAISSGDMEYRVKISRNDELGDLGLAFNQMAEGLKERNLMRQSLELAMEIQQNLLPKDNPKVKGLDIAGKSVYCDETGGDYYDFLKLKENGSKKIGIILGDISGHGIPSALLMATARAFIRQRSFLPGSLTEIITDINVLLCADAMESNSFMTLFYAVIDTNTKSVKWVRAGHDPAIIYDPKTDIFEELRGPAGVPIGVVPDCCYEENEKTGLEKGQVIVISTDGINEAFNPKKEMYGKERILDAIKKNKQGTAEQILEAIISDLNRFRQGLDLQDDVTLIVIKIMD
ncbi:MAG: SpoIIE family protein phosphatase [Desulfobacterales bacterium]|nr:SpoIIE family protein phosphatase [Desulfobacterales bacterium]